MIDVEQVAVESEMLVLVHLNSSIRRLVGHFAGRKLEFGKQGKGWQGDFG